MYIIYICMYNIYIYIYVYNIYICIYNIYITISAWRESPWNHAGVATLEGSRCRHRAKGRPFCRMVERPRGRNDTASMENSAANDALF